MNTQPPAAKAGGGFFADPIATWENDDLLLSEEERQKFAEADRATFDVLNWPELRDEFNKYDGEAKVAKRRTERTRLLTVVAATAGLLLTAISPVLPMPLQAPNGLLAAVLTLAAGALVLVSRIGGRDRHDWMRGRYRTERLRQLNFQFLLAHFDLAAAAIRNRADLQRLEACRRQALAGLVNETLSDPRLVRDAIRELVGDEQDNKVWIDPLWGNVSPSFAAAASPHLLDTLFRRRIAAQERYVRRKSVDAAANAATRVRLVDTASGLISVAMLGVAVAIGVAFALGAGPRDANVVWLLVAEAAGGALLVGLRLGADTLGLSGDAQRYSWYSGAMANLRERYRHAESDQRKFAVLREVERESYREMREFIALHRKAGLRLP